MGKKWSLESLADIFVFFFFCKILGIFTEVMSIKIQWEFTQNDAE